MSIPGSFPDWDTNATHTTATTGGHATDGYAHNDVPTSDETNYWMMLVGLWIRYFAGGVYDNDLEITGDLKVDGTTELIGDTMIEGTLTIANTITQTCSVTDSFDNGAPRATPIHVQNNFGWEFAGNVAPISYLITGLRMGDTIEGYLIHFNKQTSNAHTITMGLYFTAGNDPTPVSASPGTTITASGVYSSGENPLASPVVVDPYKSYFINIAQGDTTTGPNYIRGVTAIIKRTVA